LLALLLQGIETRVNRHERRQFVSREECFCIIHLGIYAEDIKSEEAEACRDPCAFCIGRGCRENVGYIKKKDDVKWEYGFTLQTKERIYELYSATQEERLLWIHAFSWVIE